MLATLKSLYPTIRGALEYANNIELLFAVMLSAQTTDKQVNKVTAQLFKKYPTLAHYANADLAAFAQDISSIGLYKSKAKNIIATANILRDEHGGEVPHTIEELIALPGVGRKTANVTLGAAYNIADGIAVDTHVIRLSKRHDLTTHSDAKKIEKDLMALVPQNEWVDFTNRMIQYGRDYCPARTHEHENCPITKALKNCL